MRRKKEGFPGWSSRLASESWHEPRAELDVEQRTTWTSRMEKTVSTCEIQGSVGLGSLVAESSGSKYVLGQGSWEGGQFGFVLLLAPRPHCPASPLNPRP